MKAGSLDLRLWGMRVGSDDGWKDVDFALTIYWTK